MEKGERAPHPRKRSRSNISPVELTQANLRHSHNCAVTNVSTARPCISSAVQAPRLRQRFGKWRDWPLRLALSAAVSGDFPQRKLWCLTGRRRSDSLLFVAFVANRAATYTGRGRERGNDEVELISTRAGDGVVCGRSEAAGCGVFEILLRELVAHPAPVPERCEEPSIPPPISQQMKG